MLGSPLDALTFDQRVDPPQTTRDGLDFSDLSMLPPTSPIDSAPDSVSVQGQTTRIRSTATRADGPVFRSPSFIALPALRTLL